MHDEELRRLGELVRSRDHGARVRVDAAQLRLDVERPALDVAEGLRIARARAQPRGRAQVLQRRAQCVQVILHLLRDDDLGVELGLSREIDEHEGGERDDGDRGDREARGGEPGPRNEHAHG